MHRNVFHIQNYSYTIIQDIVGACHTVRGIRALALLGDGLAEPLLAFLAGGGEPLAERDGEGEAEPGAGRFRAAGGAGETDLDLEDILLIGWGLAEDLERGHGGENIRAVHSFQCCYYCNTNVYITNPTTDIFYK